MTDKLPGTRQGVLSLEIKDKSALYGAYMSFLKHGGLFVPTGRQFALGDKVSIMLRQMDDPETIPVGGRVVWVTPKGARRNRAAGIGMKFVDENGAAVRAKIESYLACALESECPTHTR